MNERQKNVGFPSVAELGRSLLCCACLCSSHGGHENRDQLLLLLIRSQIALRRPVAVVHRRDPKPPQLSGAMGKGIGDACHQKNKEKEGWKFVDISGK